jgi:hypothetical protein
MRPASLRWRKSYTVLLAAGLLCLATWWLIEALRIKPLKFEGILTLDGRPVKNAFITFVPDNKGPIANARTSPDGRFQLGTWGEGDGILPGDYQVCVVKLVGSPNEDPGEPVPTIYSTQFKSPLRCHVPPPEGRISVEMKSEAGTALTAPPGIAPSRLSLESEAQPK